MSKEDDETLAAQGGRSKKHGSIAISPSRTTVTAKSPLLGGTDESRGTARGAKGKLLLNSGRNHRGEILGTMGLILSVVLSPAALGFGLSPCGAFCSRSQ